MKGRAAAALLLVAGSLSGCGLTASSIPLPGASVSGETYTLKAVFTDALNLPAQAKVKLGGVDIGRVADMTVDGYNAVVEMTISAQYEVPRGSRMQLRQTSALGDMYVAITAPAKPTRGFLEDGDVVTTKFTRESPGIEDALAAMSTLTNGGGISQVTTIVRESNRALARGSGSVPALLDELTAVMATLDARTGDINAILESSAGMTRTLRKNQSTIDAVLRDIGPAAELVADQTDELVVLLQRIDHLARTGQNVVASVGAQARRLLASVGPMLDGFIALDEHLRPSFLNMRRFEEVLGRILPGDVAAGYLDFTGVLPDGTGGEADQGGRGEESSSGDLPPLADLLGLSRTAPGGAR